MRIPSQLRRNTLIASTALVLAALAASLSLYNALEGRRAREEMVVQAQLQTYLTDYAALRTSYDNAGFSESSYFDCDAYDLRLRAGAAAAMLLATVESMKEAHDPRADKWAGYLSGYPGPIHDFGLLDAYVRSDWGRRKLADARSSAPWKRYPKCAEPDISRLPSAVPKGAGVS